MQTHKITLSYPTSWLTVNVEIRNRTTDAVLESGVAVENGTTATYDYDFDGADNTDYIYIATVTGLNTMRGAVYYEVSGGWSGLTTEEHDKLMGITGGGGMSINYQAINSHTTSKVNELKEEIAKIPKTDLSGIENTLNDIDSHINLAKEDIIDTINEIENEICSDVVRTKTEIKKDNVSTRQLIRQKAEKIDKNVSKLADRQDLTDKMIEDEADELEDQIEELYEKEANDLEIEIDDQLNQEFDQIESEINQLTNGNN